MFGDIKSENITQVCGVLVRQEIEG